MIVLPLTTESAPAPAATPRPAAAHRTLKVLVLGFTPPERELLEGVVALSQRRSLRLQLVGPDAAASADVLLLDGSDARIMAWAASPALPAGKTVIQVDGRSPTAGRQYLPRPVQWSILPALLQRALGMDISDSARQPLAAH